MSHDCLDVVNVGRSSDGTDPYVIGHEMTISSNNDVPKI